MRSGRERDERQSMTSDPKPLKDNSPRCCALCTDLACYFGNDNEEGKGCWNRVQCSCSLYEE